MSAPEPEAVVAWLDRQQAPVFGGLDVRSFPSLAAVVQCDVLPSVLVLGEGALGWSLDDCFVQAAAPALASMTVMVLADTWSSHLAWRGAQVGVFCCLARGAAMEELEAALRAAAHDALVRRGRLRPNHDLRVAGACLQRAEFHFKTMEEAETLAVLVSSAMPLPERRLGGALELLINAVEHGNLGVSFDEKRAMLLDGTLHDELKRRLGLAPWAARVVTVTFERLPALVRLCIEDEGQGFDFEAVLSKTPELTALHGRGIYLARAMSFDRVRYEGRGQRVVTEVDR